MGFASCKAFGRSISASLPNPKPLPLGKGLNVGLPPHQARTLAVSRTQSLHDAATPTTDDLHWGYTPNPILISCISFSTDCLNTYLFSSAIILSTRAACLPPSNSVDRNTLTISSAVPAPITLPPMHRTFASL